VLGALSKSLATLATQPLIVAKVGLQSKPPPERKGREFTSFGEVLAHIVEHEGVQRIFKGIGPQLLKGILVQGFLMMTKERYVQGQLIKTHTNFNIGSNSASFCCSDISVPYVPNSSGSWLLLQAKRLPKQVLLF
jgi:hypothetical protein